MKFSRNLKEIPNFDFQLLCTVSNLKSFKIFRSHLKSFKMFVFGLCVNRLRQFWPTWQPTPTADPRSFATAAFPSSCSSCEVQFRPRRQSPRPSGGRRTLPRWPPLKGSFRNQQLLFQGKQQKRSFVNSIFQ